MFYATTRSKTVICIPDPEKYSVRTLCGKQIKVKVEEFARNGRLRNLETCATCRTRQAIADDLKSKPKPNSKFL